MLSIVVDIDDGTDLTVGPKCANADVINAVWSH